MKIAQLLQLLLLDHYNESTINMLTIIALSINECRDDVVGRFQDCCDDVVVDALMLMLLLKLHRE